MQSTTKPRGLAKIWREIKRPVRQIQRVFQPEKPHPSLILPQPIPRAVPQTAAIVSKFQPPVPTIPWIGQTRTPLVLTPQQRESLHPLSYHLDHISDATKYVDFRGKTVLEIGGSNLPHDLVFGILGAKKWICINLLERESNALDWNGSGWYGTVSKNIYPLNHLDSKSIIQDSDYVIFDGSATEIGEELHEEFDACISISAFEHIHGLHKAVDGIYRSLKNNGILFTRFGPIWSGDLGHHFWIDNDKYNFTKSHACHVPPFVHLLHSATEIDQLLAPYYTTEEEIRIKSSIVKQCTDGSTSNCLFYEDFFDIMKDSAFQNISVTSYWDNVLDKTTWLQLCHLYPTYRSFNINGIRIVAQKQNN